ncbi:MAG: hypothetical protein M1812_004961 [Candelaria pacifica]|nr:MAG: hypothetical protein M1812_004961 [Candelaria pacifica]
MQHSNPANLPTLSSTSPISTSPYETTTPTTTSPSHSPLSHHHHHHRRRYLSNASSSSSNTNSIRDAASTSAKRELAHKIREDWSFTWPPSPSSTTSNGHHKSSQDPPPSDIQEWRFREVDSSSPSPSPSPGPDPSSSSTEIQPIPSDYPNTDPYKFDSPDAIGTTFAELASQRKRKRRKQLEEEMASNEGLRCWVAQRDAWSGGRTQRRPNRPSSQQRHSNYFDGVMDSHHTTPTNPSTLEETSQQPISPTDSNPPYEIETLLPLAPPLLPSTNPIRASITPSTYPSIYSKVVIQGLSPTVPINLSDITKALVQGWKEDDQWPPKASAPEPMFSSRRNRGIARKEGNNGGGGGIMPTVEKHPHLNRGVGAVKKVLGLEARGSGGSSGGLSREGEEGRRGG